MKSYKKNLFFIFLVSRSSGQDFVSRRGVFSRRHYGSVELVRKKKIKEQGRKMSTLLACLLLVLLEPPSDKTFRSKCCQLRKSSVRFWGKKIFFLLEKINIIQWRKEEKSGKEIRLPRRDFL